MAIQKIKVTKDYEFTPQKDKFYIGFTGTIKAANYPPAKINSIMQNMESSARNAAINAGVNFNNDVVFVSGGAKGIDTFAEKIANKYNIDMVVFRPGYGAKGAPLYRNTYIAEFSNVLLAYPKKGGASPGTWDTINKAKKFGVPVSICPV